MQNSTCEKFHQGKLKFHPQKFPPEKIPLMDNSTQENSTHRKFHGHPWKIPPKKIPPHQIQPKENSTEENFIIGELYPRKIPPHRTQKKFHQRKFHPHSVNKVKVTPQEFKNNSHKV